MFFIWRESYWFCNIYIHVHLLEIVDKIIVLFTYQESSFLVLRIVKYSQCAFKSVVANDRKVK